MNFEKYLPYEFCKWLDVYGADASDVTLTKNQNMYITCGNITTESDCYVTEDVMRNTINRMCHGSIYANQKTLKSGYLTLEGGNRVGVVGTIVSGENGNITYMRDITTVNIRISRTIAGVGDKVIPYIAKGRIYNTLIIAPPSSGKTTLLRDIANQLGENYRVGVIDERNEIITDTSSKFVFVMRGCSKHEGILSTLRSMAPQIILTDEIGTAEDEAAIEKLINAGCKIICTAHGYSEKDLLRRKVFRNLICSNIFEKLVILSQRNGVGTVEKIINTEDVNYA